MMCPQKFRGIHYFHKYTTSTIATIYVKTQTIIVEGTETLELGVWSWDKKWEFFYLQNLIKLHNFFELHLCICKV